MKLAEQFYFMSLAAVTISVGVGYIASGFSAWAIAIFLLGGFWAIAYLWKWPWGNSFSFALFCLAIVFGAWVEVNQYWLIIAIISALAAWDIANLIARTRRVARIDDEDNIVVHHLRRLGGVLVIGLVVCLLALNLRLTLTFGWILILGFMMILALSKVVSFLRQR